MVKNSVRDDVNKYYQKYLTEFKPDCHAFKAVKRFTKHKNKSSEISSIFTDPEKQNQITDPEIIVEKFADRFSANHQLTVDFASPHEEQVKNSLDELSSINNDIIFNDNVRADVASNGELIQIEDDLPEEQRGLLTTTEEVTEIIKSRSNKKSTGDDNTPNTVIKNFSIKIITMLTILFNHMIAVGYFPSAWKNRSSYQFPNQEKIRHYWKTGDRYHKSLASKKFTKKSLKGLLRKKQTDFWRPIRFQESPIYNTCTR